MRSRAPATQRRRLRVSRCSDPSVWTRGLIEVCQQLGRQAGQRDLVRGGAGPVELDKHLRDLTRLEAGLRQDGLEVVDHGLASRIAILLVASQRARDDAIQAGREEIRRGLRLYADCEASNKWPGYSGEFQDISITRYATTWPLAVFIRTRGAFL